MSLRFVLFFCFEFLESLSVSLLMKSLGFLLKKGFYFFILLSIFGFKCRLCPQICRFKLLQKQYWNYWKLDFIINVKDRFSLASTTSSLKSEVNWSHLNEPSPCFELRVVIFCINNWSFFRLWQITFWKSWCQLLWLLLFYLKDKENKNVYPGDNFYNCALVK